jgi:hypothetical protein
MVISTEIHHVADKNWNKRLIESKFGTTSQMSESSFQFIKNNQIPIFLKFIDNKGNIVGQLLLSEVQRFQENPHREKNFTNKLNKFSKLLNLLKVKTKLYRWSYGPVIFNDELSLDVYSALRKFLLSDGQHQVLGWQHPYSISGLSGLKNSFNIIKWNTYIIDLSKTKDELFNNIEKHSGQKNIKRAIKRGIEIEEINEDNLFDYFTLLNSSKQNRGGLKSNYNYFSQVWKSFKPFGQYGFLAKKDSKPISGLLFSCISGHIIEAGVARSIADKTNMLYSQDLIRWKIIEWGVDNNMKGYNLAGFNPNLSTKKENGIFRYKKKWGGDLFDYYGIQLK